MANNDSKTLNELHFALHVARQIKNDKPTAFESKVSYILSKHFESQCSDCKQSMDLKRINAERQIKGEVQQKGFLDNILGR